jgi:hypothetical protein
MILIRLFFIAFGGNQVVTLAKSLGYEQTPVLYCHAAHKNNRASRLIFFCKPKSSTKLHAA